MAGFDVASSVIPGRDGYEAYLDPQWTVNGNPNGGYLLAVMARAAITTDEQSRHPHPVTASAVYLAPPQVGPATIAVEPLRQGRAASQLRARLTQGGRSCVEALFTLGSHDEQAPARWVGVPRVDLAPERDCPVSPVEPPGAGVRVEMLSAVQQRLDPASLHEPGEFRGWLRFADGTSFDPVSLLFAADSFPPATLTLGSVGWAPTLELTVYVRGMPEPGPLRIRQRARLLHGDTVDQQCDVWDRADRLVAQASQLALVRLPTVTDPGGSRRGGSGPT